MERETHLSLLKLVDRFLQKGDFEIKKEELQKLSPQELSEFITLLRIHYLMEQEDKVSIPDFYLYKVKEYFQKLKRKEGINTGRVILKLFPSRLELLENHSSLVTELSQVPVYRGVSMQEKKIITLKEKELPVMFYFLHQQDSVLLNISLQNLYGPLTVRLYQDDDLVYSYKTMLEEDKHRISIDNLKKGEYHLSLSGAYNQEFMFVIE